MFEEILLKEQLTKEQINAGARLVNYLLQTGMPIYVAMWFFTPENNKWRLLISSPIHDSDPRGAWSQIDDAKIALGKEIEELLYLSVGGLSTRDELVYDLMHDPYLPRDGKPISLTHAGVRGRFVDDALVYRAIAAPQ